MKICVVGLWHLGTVTAACLASGQHDVVGLDFDPDPIAALNQGRAPLFEPGLDDLLGGGLASGRLRFTCDIADAVRSAEIVWVAYDTPVDADDRADVAFVIERVTRLFPHLQTGTLVLVSSQLPAGSIRRLESAHAASAAPKTSVTFGYSPENLRLGKAIDVFTKPDRVVVGLRSEADRPRVAGMFRPFTDRIEWMGVESAEMTKHALNGFLALSVTFINEIAALCEAIGADAKEVERGLKSESRIGSKAYLGPGGPFAGGTLARDIAFLGQLGEAHHLPTHLLSSVRTSNDAHKQWVPRRLSAAVGPLQGKVIAVWGLAYKPGTDTLRRSSAVELCVWLAEQGASVRAHDPAVRSLPPELSPVIALAETALAATAGAAALVIATEWPEFRAVDAEAVAAAMTSPVVIDANRFLAHTLGGHPGVKYIAVGQGER